MTDTGWDSGKLLELSGGYWKTCTLHAGVKLGVFTAIGKGETTSKELAASLKVDTRALTMLLNALTAMGLLMHEGDRYRNTPESFEFLSRDSEHYLGYIILHHHHLVDSWSQLPTAVQTGGPVRGRVSFGDKERREAFLMGMFNLAMAIAPRVVDVIDLSGRRRLLDLGGGPGTYAIHFCLKNPDLRAIIYDLETTRPFAEATVAKFGLTDRIEFMSGNYLEEERIEGRYDVAWLSHILHGEGPEDCQAIVDKTAAALEPGGVMLIHEFILTDSMDGPVFPALFSLNMLLGTDSGQAYSDGQLRKMMEAAGARETRRLPFVGPNESGIVMGVFG